jgi:hypothetical protein
VVGARGKIHERTRLEIELTFDKAGATGNGRWIVARRSHAASIPSLMARRARTSLDGFALTIDLSRRVIAHRP